MSYIAPIHRASGARCAIKLNFIAPGEDSIVVAKANRLEIYAQTSEGLALVSSKTVYGYITMLERLRPASSPTDHLFVGTDRYQYFTCSWNAATNQLRTEQSYVDQADKVLRDSKEMDRCHIDSTRRFMTLELFDGHVTIVPIVQPIVAKNAATRRQSAAAAEPGSLGEPVQVRIEELITRSSALVQIESNSKQNPRLAILWDDNQDIPQLKIRELKYFPPAAGEPASAELVTVVELQEKLEAGVSHLVPVPPPFGGFLILGESSIAYVDSQLSRKSFQIKQLEEYPIIWTAWEQVDDTRWLLADDYGRLYFLMISASGSRVDSWKLDALGITSRASCLVYLDAGFVFVGSHSGDSLVVRIVERGVEVVQTLPNIAPILDLTVMDLGRGSQGGQVNEFSSGQARLVTASGAWQDGSIRSVRSGVGMEDIGIIGQLPHIADMWALSSTGTSTFQDLLLLTFADETRMLKFDSDAAVEELEEFLNFVFSEPTIFASNLPDGKLLQVYESGICIADLESGMSIAQWKPPDSKAKITAACANAVHLLVVAGGNNLHVFHTPNANLNPTTSKTFPPNSQISSIALPTSDSNICVVSFLQTSSVSLLDLHSLDILHTETLGVADSTFPRSVLIANVLPNSPPTLFIAMADGTVVTFSFDPAKRTLSGMARIILGSEPVFFKMLPRDSEPSSEPTSSLSNVFASCEQPSLIYADEGRIIYSAVNTDKSSRVCPLSSPAYPAAIALATPSELKLAMIETERTTQLQTLSVGETVRCLAYEPNLKLFAIGCIHRVIDSDGAEVLKSSIKLADEVTFKELDSVDLLEDVLIECIISTGPLPGAGNSPEYSGMFAWGTSSLRHDNQRRQDDLATRGGIAIYRVSDGFERRLESVTEKSFKGACRSLAMCGGKIVAGLDKSVVVFGIVQNSKSKSLTLNKLATYRTSTNPLSLAIQPATPTSPATIAVADLMKSLSILTLNTPSTSQPSSSSPVSTEYELSEVARHYAVLWSSAVAAIAENEWLLADSEGNLVVLRRNVSGVTSEDQRRLEVIGEFRLGELVNKIVPISVSPATFSNQVRLRPGSTSAIAQPPSSATDTGVVESRRTGPVVTPKAFLATVDGGVYMFGNISAPYQDPLMRLQTALATKVQAPGYMPWTKFRAFKVENRESEEPFRFVDGELLENVLRMDDNLLTEVVQDAGLAGAERGGGAAGGGPAGGGSGVTGVGVTKDEVKSWVEELRRLY